MLIEIHMLKNYPPVNLNRDDSGAPKSCFFGGVQRGRISSQCLKRSWRKSNIFLDLGGIGLRTSYMPKLVGEKLINLGIDQKLADEASKKLTTITNKKGKDESGKKEGASNEKGQTQIIFYSLNEIDRIVEIIKQLIDTKGNLNDFEKTFKQFEKEKNRPYTIDIALFGRMVTSNYFEDVEAAMQVAHAISTHAVNRESDYFTAIDDYMNRASMLEDIDYNSCCYYEYAALDTDILRENLKNCPDRDALMEKLVPVLLRAMAYTNPSGKQNTFAGQVLPDLVMVECKKDKIPLSYVNAFEEPVSAWGNQPNLVKKSIEKLTAHVDCMDHAYELPVCHRAFFAPRFGETHPKACEVYDQFSALAQACAGWLQEDDAP